MGTFEWMLVVIMLAPAQAAQEKHSRVYEVIYNTAPACGEARDEILKQYGAEKKLIEMGGSSKRNTSLVHVTCIPQNVKK